MGAIRIQNVSKQFGGQIVLADVSLELQPNQTVGLVGANGSGKTTLFRLITGDLQPDTGTVTRSKGLRVGYLPQESTIALENTLHDEVASVFADLLALEQKLHDLSEQMSTQSPGAALDELMIQYDRVNARFIAAGGYNFESRINEILGGLGFSTDDYALPMSALSGGQRCRAALARLLLRPRQFLLLDEPTNHLDLDGVQWLEKFLAGHHRGAVIVSHDRYLLDRLADRIVEIERTHVRSCPGGYTNYAKTKRTRLLTEQRRYEQDRAFIEKERTFIAKHHAGQRNKEAKGRQTRLERRIAAGEFNLERQRQTRKISFRFDADDDKEPIVLAVAGLAKRYGPKKLFADLSFQLAAGRRLGVTGPNGTGKTTLLRIIMQQVDADAGAAQFEAKVPVGYYAQDAGEFDADATALEELQRARPDLSKQNARDLLARFSFTGDDVFKRLGDLSGGEQSRLRLMKLILASPGVLLLDEPTNHLDIPSREALEDALAEFPGAILAVSHDRYFLDRLCDDLLVIRPDRHAIYNGNYSLYVEQLQREAEAKADRKPARPSRKPTAKGRGAAPPAKRSRFHRHTLDELETLIMEREEQLAELNARFAEPNVYKNPQALATLRDEFDALKRELSEAEQVWNERAAGE